MLRCTNVELEFVSFSDRINISSFYGKRVCIEGSLWGASVYICLRPDLCTICIHNVF